MPNKTTTSTKSGPGKKPLVRPEEKSKGGKTEFPENEVVHLKSDGPNHLFFLPGQDISREVIQGDICRYLDHDATIKPGEFNGTKGFVINAYRNLTSAMIKDIKKDSEKFERERKEKLTKYKQEQAKKPLANNKRKMETAEPKLAYVDSKAHTQMLERFEHNELLRQQSETPASNTSGGSRGFRPPSVNAPVPPPSRNSDTAYSVGSPGYLSQPATTRAPGSFTPEYSQTTTPATELSRTSADDRKPYDNRQYAQSAAKSEEQSPIYPFQAQQLPVHPGPAPANIRRTYQDTPPPQQVARNDTTRAPAPYYDYEDHMDTEMDEPMEYDRVDSRRADPRRDSRMDPYPDDRMDYRMDDRMDRRMDDDVDDRMDDRMDYRGNPRTEAWKDPRMDPRPDPYTRPDTRPERLPERMDARMENRADPRKFRDPRPEPRMVPRMDTQPDLGEYRDSPQMRAPRNEQRGDPRREYQGDLREPRDPRGDPRRDPRNDFRTDLRDDQRMPPPPPRAEQRAATSMGMRPEPRDDRRQPRYDDQRDPRYDDQRDPRYDDRRDPRAATGDYRDRGFDPRSPR